MVLQLLERDPPLRFSVTGRTLLRLLHVTAIDHNAWSHLVRTVPGHCADTVAGLARSCAMELQRFADELTRRQSMEDNQRRPPRTGGVVSGRVKSQPLCRGSVWCSTNHR